MTPKNRRVSAPVIADDVLDVASRRPGAPETPVPPTRVGPVLAYARAVLSAALVLGLSLSVAWAVRRHVLASPRFALTDIEVKGAHVRSSDVLIAESGVVRGMNVFALDLDRARAKLLADPWIESATLARRLPGRLSMEIKEREAGAVVVLPEPYLATREGHVFKRLEPTDPVDLPVVTGLTADAIESDRAGSERLIARALDLAGDYDHAALAARAPLEEVHVGNGGELTLVVGKDGVSLALGLPPFRRKLDEASRVLAELDKRGAHATVVMLDDAARPDRVVVRTR